MVCFLHNPLVFYATKLPCSNKKPKQRKHFCQVNKFLLSSQKPKQYLGEYFSSDLRTVKLSMESHLFTVLFGLCSVYRLIQIKLNPPPMWYYSSSTAHEKKQTCKEVSQGRYTLLELDFNTLFCFFKRGKRVISLHHSPRQGQDWPFKHRHTHKSKLPMGEALGPVFVGLAPTSGVWICVCF